MGKKEIRQQKLMKVIAELGYIPRDLNRIADALHASVRTVQRDINEIRDMMPKVALDDIRDAVVLRIRHRVPDMKDSDLIRLAEFFIPKKRDYKVEGETEVLVKMWDWSKETERCEHD